MKVDRRKHVSRVNLFIMSNLIFPIPRTFFTLPVIIINEMF